MVIYNTATKQKEEFRPLHGNKVGIYCCGPTVYNYFHIGNARPFVVFDVLRRYLKYRGYDVTYVQNFTDIDDKMIRRAREENTTVAELAERYIAEYYKDADGLGILRADVNPRATQHMGEIIGLIEKLIEKGHAYEVNGDVYFSVPSYAPYGRVSGQPLEDLEAGARIEVGEVKRHPLDFALWKAQKEGEPAWESPWGMGRPGWHIECSAMSMKYLGETLDIHCGGQDLAFPHHENEVAQSEAATGKPFVRYFMHNGYINVDNRKMSKSVGNFFTVRDVAEKFDLEVVRLFLLGAHYRSPINFSEELLEQAKSGLARLYNAKTDGEFYLENAGDDASAPDAEAHFTDRAEALKGEFERAMDDDLNTADALGSLYEYVRELNILVAAGASKAAVEAGLAGLMELASVMGLLQRKAEGVDDSVMKLVEERQAARKARDFARADAIRDELAALGYAVEDTPEGPKVKPI
ncbi:cysteine--tRNA ligase [Gehongia tenuis]|uniref:Cysteine--tRNA ligase n=1 Tax=Gehongia tenuis TaxID=2763655 RepID=A0A926HNA0_9FIRM|nr:cysteine--tRNA ligase [Gehongia tenuis]MBC8530374.1 cysteine--tRNA ligase [Gehongia tenuis]